MFCTGRSAFSCCHIILMPHPLKHGWVLRWAGFMCMCAFAGVRHYWMDHVTQLVNSAWVPDLDLFLEITQNLLTSWPSQQPYFNATWVGGCGVGMAVTGCACAFEGVWHNWMEHVMQIANSTQVVNRYCRICFGTRPEISWNPLRGWPSWLL